MLILLLEPPARIFTAWTSVCPDRRPAWLALGLFLTFVVVLLVPATRSYFGLTAPDPPILWIGVPALVLWFVTVSLALRFRVLERVLGLAGHTGSLTGGRRGGAPERAAPDRHFGSSTKTGISRSVFCWYSA